MNGKLEPPFRDRDPRGMGGLIEGASDQIERALALVASRVWSLPLRDPDLLAVGGLGGSAIAADLARGVDGDRLPHPLLVVRDYRWPACVTPRSLALLSSYSGETEETLSLYQEAGERGVPRVAITTGGTLAERCRHDQVPCLPLDPGMSPRAALYMSWVCVSHVLHTLGWIEDPVAAWRESAHLLRARNAERATTVPEERNPAKRAARLLDRRFVFLYGATARLGAVATRMRNQLNENAKLLAHSALVPELQHNEIVGWDQPPLPEDRVAALILRDREDSPEVDLRLTLTAEFLERRSVPVAQVREDQGGRLARMVSLVHFGDYLSYYLALLNRVDPTPIPPIDELKRRLSGRGAQRA